MAKLFLLFSHKLTEDQIKDAKESLKADEFIYLPENLQKTWSNVKPSGNLDKKSLYMICEWIEAQGGEGDFVLIQGDFGATFFMVDFCFKKGFEPIYATTKRVSKEIPKSDGTIERKQIFKHVGFRKYETCR